MAPTTPRGVVLRRRAVALVTLAAFAGILVVLFTGGDSSEPDARPAPTSDVAGTSSAYPGLRYRADGVDGYDATNADLIEIELDAPLAGRGSISFNGGCNWSLGKYVMRDGRLELDGDVTSTTMGCEKALDRQADWFGRFISGARLAKDGDGFALTKDDATVTFARVQTPG